MRPDARRSAWRGENTDHDASALGASLALPVAAMRARGLGRGACGPLADRRVAAAPRRELAVRPTPHWALLCWRNKVLLSTCNMVAAGRCWCLSVTNSSVTVHLAQASSLDVLVLVGEVGLQAGMHTNCILLYEDVWRAWSPELSSLFGTWRTNGLLKIFPLEH